MPQSIESRGPIRRSDGLAEKAQQLKQALVGMLSRSKMGVEQDAKEPTFESAQAEGGEIFDQLQKLGRINFFSYSLINDILIGALKNSEQVVKVRLTVMKDGLKQGKALTEEEWGDLATKALESDNVKMWLKAHPIHKN